MTERDLRGISCEHKQNGSYCKACITAVLEQIPGPLAGKMVEAQKDELADKKRLARETWVGSDMKPEDYLNIIEELRKEKAVLEGVIAHGVIVHADKAEVLPGSPDLAGHIAQLEAEKNDIEKKNVKLIARAETAEAWTETLQDENAKLRAELKDHTKHK